MSFCLDHGDDESPWMCQCTRKKIAKLERELAEEKAHAERLQSRLAAEECSANNLLKQCDELRAQLAESNERLDAWRFHAEAWGTDPHEVRKHIAAVTKDRDAEKAAHTETARLLFETTAGRDALKAKLAAVNHIAMSLFVRATSSEVTGEMAEIGRISREDGK